MVLVAEVWVTGMVLCAVACGEAGSAVVGVDVAGSLVVCCQSAFGAQVGHCIGLEGMGCRVGYGRVRSAAPKGAEASLGVQR